MRLLVFFASTLRRLAGSLEPDHKSPLADNAGSDEGVVPRVESGYEAGSAGGPPEHWTRLIAMSPPDHWLDLVRDRAPHLPPENAGESDSAPCYETPLDHSLETELNPRPGVQSSPETGVTEEEASRPRGRRRRKEPTRNSSSAVTGAAWLSRLRFRPPKTRPATAEPAYPANEASTDREDANASDDYGTATAGHESPLTFADDYDQGREAPPVRWPDRTSASRRPDGESVTEAYEAPARRSSFETGEAFDRLRGGPAAASGPENLADTRNQPASSEARSEQPARQTTSYVRQTPAATTNPNIFVARPETNSAPPRFRSANASAEVEPASRAVRPAESQRQPAEESASFRDRAAAAPPQAARWSDRTARQPRPNSSVVNSNRMKSGSERPESPPNHDTSREAAQRAFAVSSRASESAITASVDTPAQSPAPRGQAKKFDSAPRSVEHARHRFAAVDLGATAPVDAGESMWPTLPPARAFQMTDELAAVERELETLRRLDREQRGTLWNG